MESTMRDFILFLVIVANLNASFVEVRELVIEEHDERRSTDSSYAVQAIEGVTIGPITKVVSTDFLKLCNKKVHACLQSTPFMKYKCLMKFKKCVWNYCPSRKCFSKARKCAIKVRFPNQMLNCIRILKKCMKRKGC